MLILKTVGFVVTFLSWLAVCWLMPCILDVKYKIKLKPAYWYLWGIISMGIGSILIPFLC